MIPFFRMPKLSLLLISTVLSKIEERKNLRVKIIDFSILFFVRGNNTEYIPHNIAHDCLPVDL